MFHRLQPLFLFLLHLVLLLAIPATTAAPLRRSQSVVERADTDLPKTLTSTTKINSPSGPATETCIITLTPITLQNGQQAVQQVKTCKVVKDAAEIGTPSVVSTVLPSTSTIVSSSSALSVNGVSTVTAAAAPTEEPNASPDGEATPTATPTLTPEAATNNSPGTAANVSGSPTAAAAEQTTTGSFTIPGKKLSVLPIGLGVFAGISVIALIVVGLVTYERTKYRKAFRQRKLAEAGAQMGYGGMAQRA